MAKKSDKKSFIRLALERDVGLRDVSNSYKLYRQAIGNPKYWATKFDELVKEKRLLLVRIDGKPNGFFYFSLDFIGHPSAYVELVFVSKVNRNLGIARQLFAKVEKIAAAEGYSKIFSSTNPSNRISLNMHRKFGYKRCGSIYGIETPTSREIFFSKTLK
ncbi:MAG: GNAT family N-acetyltransferase [Candidatus Aenigmarchaeota archaeon]|nr:GNAT family N-acetyltransferase [Candidatus Aenigmarchaeota archaeon]